MELKVINMVTYILNILYLYKYYDILVYTKEGDTIILCYNNILK